MIEITEFLDPAILHEKLLRERATQSKVSRSRQFIAHFDGREAGYMSFDDRSDIEVGIIYDLLILPQYRRKRIGLALVNKAEIISRSLGYRRMRTCPRAFDESVDQNWLELWYINHGYRPAEDGTQEYEKPLAKYV